MRVIIQRVSRASVSVESECKGAIEKGLMLLVGIETTDTLEQVEYCVKKCLNVKLWPDEEGGRGEWRKSVSDIQGELLVISQFTLFGNIKKGTKPDFHRAMGGDSAVVLFNKFVALLKSSYRPERIQTGVFGAMMAVELVNNGPVTIILEHPTTITPPPPIV